MKPNDLLFVYGTLRQEGRLHHYLNNCEFITKGTISGTMYDLGGFPAITLEGDKTIYGEVYRLDTEERINRLNRLEAGYQCQPVEVGGVKAWVYHIPEVVGYNRPIVEDGDWIKYYANN